MILETDNNDNIFLRKKRRQDNFVLLIFNTYFYNCMNIKYIEKEEEVKFP
jgi:hypothetical protein